MQWSLSKKELIHKGKVKNVYSTDDENTVVIEFRDEVTALDGGLREFVEGKANISNEINTFLFKKLCESGIPNHFIDELDERSFLAQKLRIIPVEVVVRNVATGSITKRLGIKEGTYFEEPVVEFFYKSDELHDPLICLEHARILNLGDEENLLKLKELGKKANNVLKTFFASRDLILVDIKFEFGENSNGEILVGDELTPDVFRIWTKDGRSLDKDVFRKKTGDLRETYQELLNYLK